MNNQTIDELRNRKLDNFYFLIMVFQTKINLNEDNGIKKMNMYIFYGCNLQGRRKYLDTFITSDNAKISDWYNFLLSFKQRNVEKIIYANIPNIKFLKDALELAFKDITVLTSCFDPIEKIFTYYTEKYTSSVYPIIKNIYLSENIEGYNSYIMSFKNEFKNYPFLLDILENDFSKAKSFYKISYLERSHIFCFYFYRDTLKRIRKCIRCKNSFDNVDEFLNLFLDTIQKNELRMYSTKSEWLKLINQLYSTKKELIKSYL